MYTAYQHHCGSACRLFNKSLSHLHPVRHFDSIRHVTGRTAHHVVHVVVHMLRLATHPAAWLARAGRPGVAHRPALGVLGPGRRQPPRAISAVRGGSRGGTSARGGLRAAGAGQVGAVGGRVVVS